jgi:aryl-alcohol dehydrogenase-like predicted oxidoreductase
MDVVTLGPAGPGISRVGLGFMGMSGVYGPADGAESIATIRPAPDARMTLPDAGDFYGMGHNELLLAEALRGVRRDHVFIQLRFGAPRDRGGAFLDNSGFPWVRRRAK